MNIRKLFKSEKGSGLLESAISVAMVGVLTPAIMAGTIGTVRATTRIDEKAVLERLAQSQIESVLEQPFQTIASNYTIIQDVPANYIITVALSVPVSYVYADLTVPAPLIQEVTVTVTSPNRAVQFVRYKVDT